MYLKKSVLLGTDTFILVLSFWYIVPFIILKRLTLSLLVLCASKSILFEIKIVTSACVHGKHFSHVWLCATPWTVAHQALLSVGFSRQEYWSGLPFPSPGDLPDPGIKPRSPALQTDVLTSEPPGKLAWNREGFLKPKKEQTIKYYF